MSAPNDSNLAVLDGLIVGRVEPQIYAFMTNSVPNYLKVGDTYRPIEKRLNEWRKFFPDLKKMFEDIAKVDEETYFRDYAIHLFLEKDLKRKRLERPSGKNIPYYSNEFFENATILDIKNAILDIKQKHQENNPKYQYYSFKDSRVSMTHT